MGVRSCVIAPNKLVVAGIAPNKLVVAAILRYYSQIFIWTMVTNHNDELCVVTCRGKELAFKLTKFWFVESYSWYHPWKQVHGANMGPIWGRQDPSGPHVGPMSFATWDTFDYNNDLTLYCADALI